MLKNSVTAPSHRAYEFGAYLYLNFCNFYGLDPYLTDKESLYKQLIRYVTFRLVCARGTYSTIASDIAAIQFNLSIHGIHCNIRNEYSPMKRLMKYAALHHPSKSQASRGLSLREFKKLINQFKPVSIDSCVFRAILSFAFATGLRGTEFLASKSKPTTRKELALLLRRDRLFLWQDPKNPEKHFGVVWFFSSKTNKQWKQEFATIPCCCNIGFCPVIDLIQVINLIKECKPQTVIFTWANGTFVTKHLFRSMLKQAAACVNLNPVGIGTHTTRKTCIQYAISYGLPDTILVQLGRWRSFHSIRPYINLSPLELLKARTSIVNDDRTRSDRFKILSQSFNNVI